MRIVTALLILIITSCYVKPKVAGFDEKVWNKPIENCSDSKMELAELVMENQEVILSKGQAQVKALLGAPDEHELYRRNQKFFYYNLTAGDTCTAVDVAMRLSVRFDALDRVKELMVVEVVAD